MPPPFALRKFLRVVLVLSALFVPALPVLCAIPSDGAGSPDTPFRVLGEYSGIGRIALSSEGSLCAFLKGTTLTLTETAGGHVRFTQPLVGGSLAFSPDGTLLAVATERSVRLLDTREGKLVRAIERTHYFDMMAIVFSPDGHKLAVNGGTLYHYSVGIFDVDSGRLLQEPIKDYGLPSLQMAFSTGGKYLAVNYRSQFRIVDAETGAPVSTTRQPVDLVWFHQPLNRNNPADSDTVGVFTQGKVTFELRQQKLTSEHATPINSAILGTHPLLTVVGSQGQIAIAKGEQAVLIDAVGNERKKLDGAGRGRIVALAASLDGSVVACGREDGRIDLWRL